MILNRREEKGVSQTDTLILMNVDVSSMDNIPKSLIIPSSNLKLNEFVRQGMYGITLV